MTLRGNILINISNILINISNISNIFDILDTSFESLDSLFYGRGFTLRKTNKQTKILKENKNNTI